MICLVDNGSLVAEATLSLRRIASALSELSGELIQPVSLLHSSGVAAERLGGRPAEILEPAVLRAAESGVRRIRILPLFFGPSRALTGYLPERVAGWRRRHPQLAVELAPWLVRLPGDGSGADREDGLAEIVAILADQVASAKREAGWPQARIALVDHGSPEPAVARVRNRVAAELCRRLAPGGPVRPCSMERRAGDEYCFNDPLLEGLLAEPGWVGPLVLAMLFLQPGRHAGPGGDVAEICERVLAGRTEVSVRMTRLVGEHPGLVRLLERRLGGDWRPL